MEQLKEMKETLMHCVQSQIYGNLDTADTHELGEAIDMIKDLSEAIYYCTITEAMDKEGSKHQAYYDKSMKPMYYKPYPLEYYKERTIQPYKTEDYEKIHDPREGRSGWRRKMYMEGKSAYHDKSIQMQELEAYMQELSTDITEMVADASAEEKALLQQKIAMLAQKIK